jgi:hypothetical protein
VVSQADLDVQVLDDPLEYQDPRPDWSRLEELAQKSGGQVLHTAEELTKLAQSFRIAPGEKVVERSPLWDHWLLWAGLILLLSLEWVLRRCWGLA